MTQPCLEIVTYKVNSVGGADHQSAQAAKRAEAMSGFAGWLPLSGSRDREGRADVVVWVSRECPAASCAGKAMPDRHPVLARPARHCRQPVSAHESMLHARPF